MLPCFQANPNSRTLKPVLRPFEALKALELRCDGEDVLICTRQGIVLEVISLLDIVWGPCALPGGKDHCLSLQFKNPQPREIVFKANSRGAVAQTAAMLDAAAARLARKQRAAPPTVEVHAAAESLTEEQAEEDAASVQGNASPPHSPSRCPRCWQLAQLLEEHEAQIRDSESLHAELESCKAEVAKITDQLNEKARHATAAEDKAKMAIRAERTALKRCEELEKSLAEASTRCECLMKDLEVAAKAAEHSAAKSKEFKASLEVAEEEKRFLVAALTTAQAQLHDVQMAFKETASQLQGASQSCTAVKDRATKTREELAAARDEASNQADIAKKAQQEATLLRAQLARAEQELATMQQLSAYAGQSETAVLEARRELDRARRDFDIDKDALRAEAAALRERAGAMEKDLAAAQAELRAQRAASAAVEKSAEAMKLRLKSALEAHASSVSECKRAQVRVDELNLAVERAERRGSGAEARCRALESRLGMAPTTVVLSKTTGSEAGEAYRDS